MAKGHLLHKTHGGSVVDVEDYVDIYGTEVCCQRTHECNKTLITSISTML